MIKVGQILRSSPVRKSMQIGASKPGYNIKCKPGRIWNDTPQNSNWFQPISSLRTIASMTIGTIDLHHRSILKSSGRSVSTSISQGSDSALKSNSQKKSQKSENSKSNKTAGDYFLDYLGQIFLSAIALIILSLIRSSKGTSNRTNLRTELERDAALDPAEIDDLRIANSELDREAFETIVKALLDDVGLHVGNTNGASSSNDGKSCSSPSFPPMTYTEFISRVTQIMKKMKGDQYTIQLAHLIDRVVLTAIDNAEKKQQKTKNDSNDQGQEHDMKQNSGSYCTEDSSGNILLDLSFLLAVLSSCLNTPTVRDRVEVLFDIMHRECTYEDGYGIEIDRNDTTLNDDIDGKEKAARFVTADQVRDMIGYLQEASQLVPDTQIVETSTKYPAQLYRRGTPDELFHLGKELKKDVLSEEALLDQNHDNKSKWTCDDFHHMLRSRSVCAWGECYKKTKGLL